MVRTCDAIAMVRVVARVEATVRCLFVVRPDAPADLRIETDDLNMMVCSPCTARPGGIYHGLGNGSMRVHHHPHMKVDMLQKHINGADEC